jgi:hypothetical protein
MYALAKKRCHFSEPSHSFSDFMSVGTMAASKMHLNA